jgi:hypothetical protein
LISFFLLHCLLYALISDEHSNCFSSFPLSTCQSLALNSSHLLQLEPQKAEMSPSKCSNAPHVQIGALFVGSRPVISAVAQAFVEELHREVQDAAERVLQRQALQRQATTYQMEVEQQEMQDQVDRCAALLMQVHKPDNAAAGAVDPFHSFLPNGQRLLHDCN